MSKRLISQSTRHTDSCTFVNHEHVQSFLISSHFIFAKWQIRFFFLLIVNDTNSSNDGTYRKWPSILMDISSLRYSSIFVRTRWFNFSSLTVPGVRTDSSTVIETDDFVWILARYTPKQHAVINIPRYSACQLNPYACSKNRIDVTDETFLFIAK